MRKGPCTGCGGRLQPHEEIKEGSPLRGTRCSRCGEVLFSASELIRWEVVSGKRKGEVRRIRRIGGSLVVTIPDKVVKGGMREDDYALFRRKGRRLLVEIIHPEPPSR